MGLFIVAGWALGGCGGEAAAAPGAPVEETAVRVEVVKRGEATRHLRYAGVVGAKDEATLGMAVGGRVEAVLVEEGARVKRGQVLARLDGRTLGAAVAQAAAGVRKAERDLVRLKALHEVGTLPLGEMQNAETGAEVARAALQGAAAYRDLTVLVAPSAGVIEKRMVEPGEAVGPGQPLFRMRGAGGWVVRVGVVDRDVVALERGRKAEVVLDARPGEVLEAEVSEIAEQATPRMGTFEVELRLKSEPRGVRAGLPAKVTVPVVLGNAATVPASALLPGGAGPELLVLDGGGTRVQRRGVQLAFLSEDRAVLAGGVEEGEQVVIQGGAALGSGERVRVVTLGGAR
ncbi:MAG: efflux RND transporter periplasmic adaptor subunit [Polyangiaceae bacterium]|nr:efflux RND transporter periplasmic adaptor subunit [Polyangiaceae bacterium]